MVSLFGMHLYSKQNLTALIIRSKRNMCLSDHPTVLTILRRLTQVFFYCATPSFCNEDHIEKHEVIRTTLR